MNFENKISLILGQKTKRIRYLTDQLIKNSSNMENTPKEEISSMLTTMNSLLLKISGLLTIENNQDQIKESLFQLDSIDRKLTSIFESNRFATSDIGGFSIKDDKN